MGSARIHRRRAAVVLIAVALTLGIPAASRAMGDRADAPTTYVVRSGDTLWSIARLVAPDRDPRTVVDAIERTTGIQPDALVPGQVVLVPS